jgi:hypothetical protein
MMNIENKKDPNGIMGRDMKVMYQMFKPKPITPTMSEAQIMYNAGQQSVIAFMERQFLGKTY